ncbi:TonB-dependent receptor [Neisseria sp. N95_16]|uniref:TonB-dependent receptor n=1 Tax=Neisseria brasiliensis TaxID=2666100 RepID=A0A7X2GXC5_9NEIS|nr:MULTISPECIES: TonB-dependent receptor [Neisseria]MRN37730.1 TonB-dependent receptor [Neisseria brasiliensis]PJO10661.1 TonB-dependent receptor [Neisseria sp. N95_16]
MNTRRADLHGEWKEPLPSVAKISLRLSHTDYYHDEKDAGKEIDLNPYDSHGTADNYDRANNIFKNKGFGSRIEVHHKPYHGFTGVWGAQWQRNKSSTHHSKILSGELKENWMLVENTNKQFGLFATGQWRWKDLTLEFGGRTEKQEIPIEYEREKLIIQRGCDPKTSWLCWRPKPTVYAPAPEIYNKRANSYAASMNWDFHPDYTLSLMYSHNERHPSPMELYYTGEHLATNSFEYGKKDLDKEQSDNVEIGLRHASDKWDYNISAYHNRFENYIYKQTIFQYGTLATYRYAQSQARFHGLEGSVSYRPDDKHQITLWGDYVRGKLVNLPDYIRYDTIGSVDEVHKKADRNAPRVPPARIGLRINNNWNERWQTKIDYTRVFTQNKVSFFESFSDERPDLVERKTKGYHLLNLGVAYRNKVGSMKYRIYADANNVLNKKIYTHTSFLPYVPQIGRNFVFGVNMTF